MPLEIQPGYRLEVCADCRVVSRSWAVVCLLSSGHVEVVWASMGQGVRAVSVYTDTSVFGGVFDDEFEAPSKSFFDLVRAGRFSLLVSDVTRQEIAFAPSCVQAYFDRLLAFVRLVPVDERVIALRDAYVDAGILTAKWADDAAHVAAATVVEADLIVSWNFRHIVHFDKIRLYNAVNAWRGYRPLEIRSPLEVIEYEDEDV